MAQTMIDDPGFRITLAVVALALILAGLACWRMSLRPLWRNDRNNT